MNTKQYTGGREGEREDLFQIALFAVSEAMKAASKFMEDSMVISSKGKDIKTQADLEMNDCILKILEPTGIPVITEESDHHLEEIPSFCWIIDPLDGTLNFSRKFPCSGISICLWENNLPVIGIVKDIFNNITYTSQLNKGSWIDNNRLRVSNVDSVKNAILATGFPSGASYGNENLLSLVKNIQSFKKVRALGSSTIMLCYVASGIFDVYHEKDIYLWDVAAGLCLIRESGGNVLIRRNGKTQKYEVLASNRNITKEASELFFKF